MKKFTLLTLLVGALSTSYGQISVSESFEFDDLPNNWTNTGGASFYSGNNLACSGSKSAVSNIYDSGWWGDYTNSALNSPVYTSDGTALQLSLSYKATNYNGGDITPSSDYSLAIKYSTDNGSTWITKHTVDATNNTSSQSCGTVNLNFLAGEIPVGNVQFKFEYQLLNLSNDIYVILDDIVISQSLSIPTCPTNIIYNSSVSNCGNLGGTIVWDANSLATTYQVSVGTSPNTSDIYSGFSYTNSFTLNNTNAGTTYYVKVLAINSEGTSTSCTETSFTTSEEICYCTSVPTSIDGNGIASVQIGETLLTQGAVSYFDHTSTLVNVNKGVATPISILFQTGYTYNTNIWVDLDSNGNFESSELLYQGESLDNTPTTLLANITLPETLANGNYRMRIGTADSGQYTPNPCYSDSYGVTLDYTLNVLDVPSCLPPTDLSVSNITNNSAVLSWSSASTNFDIQYGITGFSLGQGTIIANTTNNYSLTDLTQDTNYSYYVRAICDNTNSTWSGPYNFFTGYCASQPSSLDNQGITTIVVNNQSENVSFTVAPYYINNAATNFNVIAGEENTIAITVETGENDPDWGEYGYSYALNVWVDLNNNLSFDNNEIIYQGVSQDEVASSIVNGTFTIPANTPEGTYRMRIVVMDDEDEIPDPCFNDGYGCTVDFTLNVTNSLSNGNQELKALQLYPNPTYDIVSITNDTEIQNVEIFDVNGRKLYSQNVNSTEFQINLQSFASGTYIVKVSSEGRQSTKKLIKK